MSEKLQTEPEDINGGTPSALLVIANNHRRELLGKIHELEEAMQSMVDSIRVSLPDGYVCPSKEPEFVTAFNQIEELLKHRRTGKEKNQGTPITEQIPDNIPEWAIKAMSNGTLFKDVFKRVFDLEGALQDYIDLYSNSQGYGYNANMLKTCKKLLEK